MVDVLMSLWLLPLLMYCSYLLFLKSISGLVPGKMATIQNMYLEELKGFFFI